MKVRRTEKIKVNTFRVGDVIRFKLSDGEKVEMLAVKEEKDGMLFCFADCLAKEYSMNAQNTNAGGWDASDLRKKLNGEILDRFPGKSGSCCCLLKTETCCACRRKRKSSAQTRVVKMNPKA